MISESGSTTDPGDPMRQRDWLVRAAGWIARHRAIRAWVYNDALSPAGFDYRLSTPSVMYAFRSTSGRLARRAGLDGGRNAGCT
jgi:hypothetical protein